MNRSILDGFFEEEDFNELAQAVQRHRGDGRIARGAAMGIANRILRDWLLEQPKGGTSEWDPRWSEDEIERHLALPPDGREWEGYLVDIQQVKP